MFSAIARCCLFLSSNTASILTSKLHHRGTRSSTSLSSSPLTPLYTFASFFFLIRTSGVQRHKIVHMCRSINCYCCLLSTSITLLQLWVSLAHCVHSYYSKWHFPSISLPFLISSILCIRFLNELELWSLFIGIVGQFERTTQTFLMVTTTKQDQNVRSFKTVIVRI